MSHMEIDSDSESDDDKVMEFPEVRNEDSEDDEEDSETESSDSTSSAGTMPAIEGHDDRSVEDRRSLSSVPGKVAQPVDSLFGPQIHIPPQHSVLDSPTVRMTTSPEPQRNSRRLSTTMRSPSLTSVGSGSFIVDLIDTTPRDGMPPLPRTVSIENRDFQATLAQSHNQIVNISVAKGESSLSSTTSAQTVQTAPFVSPSIPVYPPQGHVDDDEELYKWDLVNNVQRNLKSALKRQQSLVKQSDKSNVEILRLIVHSLQSRPNMVDVVSAIRREAQSRGMPLLLNPDVLVAGKEKGGFDATELHVRVQQALKYLPPLETNPWGHQEPWPTNNFWIRTVPLVSPRSGKRDKNSQFVTLTALIDHLLLDDVNAGDYPFVRPIRDNLTNRFFLVHVEFVTPDMLFTHLARFFISIPAEYLSEERFNSVSVRVLKVLDHWIRYALVDFPEQLLLKARAFVAYIRGRHGPNGGRSISKAIFVLSTTIEKSLAMGTPRIPIPKQIVADEEPPEPKLDGVNGQGIIGNIQGLNHEEVARQMCLLAFNNFSQISIRQFFHSAWNPGNLWAISLDFRIASERIAAYREWIASQIIRGETPEKRLATIHHFINIARHCLALQNLTAAQAIYSGVSHMAVNRMKTTIGDPRGSTLNKKRNSKGEKSEHEIYLELDLDPFKLQEMNQVLAKAVESNKPCLPDLGLTFSNYFMRCYEGQMGDSVVVKTNPDDTTTDFINWKKMEAISSEALVILILQSRPYNFKPVPQIQDLLINLPGKYPDDVLLELAEQKEPYKAPPKIMKYEDPESEDSYSDSPKGKWGKMKKFFKRK